MEIHRNEQLTIGTNATVVSIEKDNANATRVSIILQNTSTGGQVVTLAIDATANAGEGIVLSPGGSWVDSMDGGYKPTQRLITAVSSAAGGKLSLQERCGQ